MCLAPALPLPPVSLAVAQPHPLAAALHPFAAAHIAALVGAPLPPRGPPAQACFPRIDSAAALAATPWPGPAPRQLRGHFLPSPKPPFSPPVTRPYVAAMGSRPSRCRQWLACLHRPRAVWPARSYRPSPPCPRSPAPRRALLSLFDGMVHRDAQGQHPRPHIRPIEPIASSAPSTVRLT